MIRLSNIVKIGGRGDCVGCGQVNLRTRRKPSFGHRNFSTEPSRKTMFSIRDHYLFGEAQDPFGHETYWAKEGQTHLRISARTGFENFNCLEPPCKSKSNQCPMCIGSSTPVASIDKKNVATVFDWRQGQRNELRLRVVDPANRKGGGVGHLSDKVR